VRRADVSLPPQAGSHWDIPEERVKISWVTIDRICQEEADAKENIRRELEHARQAAALLGRLPQRR
jgi:hypothetical protein